VLSRALVSRRFVRVVSVALCTVAGVFASSVAAQAALVHPLVSSFGSFASVAGVAVDQSSGNVYVLDAGVGSVLKFDAAGNPVDFSGSAGNTIEGVGGAGHGESEIAVDSSTGPDAGDIYIANNSVVQIYSSAGAKLGELTGGEACGVAVDPSGDVYAGFYPNTVRKYVPTVNPVSNANETASLNGLNSICNVAADGEGNVYAATYSGGVSRYEALQFGSLAASGTVIDTRGSTLAVDPATNDVYVDEGTDVAQFSASGSLTGNAGAGAITSSYGVAVKAGGDIYASTGAGQVAIFGSAIVEPDVATQSASNLTTTTARLNGTVDPDDTSVSSCEFEYGTEEGVYDHTVACAQTLPLTGESPQAVSAEISGLTLGSTYYYRLAATNSGGTNRGEGVAFTIATPGVESESVSNVQTTGVKLNAQIDPEGLETTAYFQYGTASCSANPSSCTDVPAPPGAGIGSGHTSTTVTAMLQNLQPGTVYYYRVLATNSLGSSEGTSHSFTTFIAAKVVTDGPLPTVGAPGLHDHRVYEQVTPVDKNERGLLDAFNGPLDLTQASPSGESIAYQSQGSFGDSVVGGTANTYIATRGTNGWTTHAVLPARRQQAALSTITAGFSPDLAYEVLVSADEPLASGELSGTALNLYVRNNQDGSYAALTKGAVAEPKSDTDSVLDEFSANDQDILFENVNPLTAGAPTEAPENLYDWSNGTPTLVGVLPDGTVSPAGATAGSSGGSSTRSVEHAMSEDGSRIFFTSEGQVYVRQNPLAADAQTVEISASQKTNGSGSGGMDPHGVQPATYWDASANGSTAIFTSAAELTNDANTGAADEGQDLYRYELESGRLADLTPDLNDEVGANVQGVVGASSDGSYIYFVASGSLAVGASAGQSSLYVWHNGTISYIASAEGSEHLILGYIPFGGNGPTARVAPDGTHMIFSSNQDLTGYQSGGHSEVYLYDAGGDVLTCVSCLPSGTAPTGEVMLPALSGIGGYNVFQNAPGTLSDDGTKVFFDSSEALVPEDTNGQMDVYEWEDGQLSLISSGQDSDPSYFQEATGDAHDVFFGTRQQLVAQDTDEERDLYDARVDGGFPHPLSPPVCSGTGCQGDPPTPPIFATPSSTTYNGVGNLASSSAKPKAAALTRAQKLSKALEACHVKKKKKARVTCEATARKKYGRTPKVKKIQKSTKTNRRGN
jgi:hypothetical protein